MKAKKVSEKSQPSAEASAYLAEIGRRGGAARAKALSKKRRQEIAASGGSASKGKAKTKGEPDLKQGGKGAS